MNAINAALLSTLGGGTALISLLGGTAIFQHMAPQRAPNTNEPYPLPYVVFNKQGGGPENTHADDARDYVYFIRGYATTAKAAGDIDEAVSALLHRKSIAPSGYSNFWLARETDIDSVETTTAGVTVYSAGALYRIRIV